MRHSLLFTLLIGLFLINPHFLSAQEEAQVPSVEDEAYVEFIDGSWAEARSLAAEQNKYIMVDAFTEWCGWCKVQDKNTFHNEKVADFMNDNLVSVKIDFEKGVGIDLAMKYRVQAFPTLLFFTPEGKLAGRIVGYDADIEKFISSVDEMRSPENHPPQVGDPNVLDPGFPEFYLSAFGKNGEKKRPKPEEVSAWLDTQEDLKSEIVWNVMSTMSLDDKYQQYYLDNLDSYKETFGEAEATGIVDNIVNTKFYQALRTQDEEKLQSVVDMVSTQEDGEAKSASLKMAYYQRTENWSQLVEAADQLIAANEYEFTGAFNSAAWAMYERCDDQIALAKASEWMHKVVLKEDENYAYLDTYAALLFKTGQTDLAMKWANRAIATGKRNNENVSGTEELIKKYTETEIEDQE
ncbi:MAG: DUF255 domain-containing protein [Bacteroidota bacterium]